MKKNNVAISVIMSVYNTETDFLNVAIQSILNQTFQNFEFIIINDGSNKECSEALAVFKDDRIQLITNPENYGLTKSLNIGLHRAKGKYIARMDADDYSYPRRLERQYRYMERHKEIDILGSWVREENKVQKCCGSVPTRWRFTRMLFDNVGIYHPTAFIRTDFLRNNDLYYNEAFKKAQDFELWSRCLTIGRMYVFPEVLLNYRIHEGQISSYGLSDQDYYNVCTRENLLKLLGVELDDREKQQFMNMNNCCMTAEETESMFDKIFDINMQKEIFDHTMLKYELCTKWIRYFWEADNREKKQWLKGKYARAMFDLRYYFYMLLIAWCKQDIFHHNREKER